MNKLLEYVGILMLLGGIAGAVYFFAFFNTTVTTQPIAFMGQSIGGGEHVNNLGLMADRQNGWILSIGSAILGTIFLLVGHSMTEKINAQEARVLNKPASTLPEPMVCASCGKYFTGSPAFCPNCGTKLS